MTGSEHKQVVKDEFTRQAKTYAIMPSAADPGRIGRLVEAVAPSAEARVLDVACGPGFLALAFAARCREVVGIDLTDAPLSIAEKNRQDQALTNVRFQHGDAEQLSFAKGEFDVVVSRFALHHTENPGQVLREMARVSKKRGLVVVEDLITSEYRERGDYQNKVERLRDPSHTRALSRSELITLCTAAGLEIEKLYSDEMVQPLEHWLANTQTPPDRADQVRALIERDAREDLSGMRPYLEDGLWFFRHPTLAVVSRRLD